MRYHPKRDRASLQRFAEVSSGARLQRRRRAPRKLGDARIFRERNLTRYRTPI
jgi:hypothetical protein